MKYIGSARGFGRILLLLICTALFSGLGIWQVQRQYEVVAAGYEVDRDLFEFRRLVERQKRLKLLLSAYHDPTVMRLYAEQELDMEPPSHERELFIPNQAPTFIPSHIDPPSATGGTP